MGRWRRGGGCPRRRGSPKFVGEEMAEQIAALTPDPPPVRPPLSLRTTGEGELPLPFAMEGRPLMSGHARSSHGQLFTQTCVTAVTAPS